MARHANHGYLSPGTTTSREEFKGWQLPATRGSLGIATAGDKMHVLIPAQAHAPCSVKQVLPPSLAPCLRLSAILTETLQSHTYARLFILTHEEDRVISVPFLCQTKPTLMALATRGIFTPPASIFHATVPIHYLLRGLE